MEKKLFIYLVCSFSVLLIVGLANATIIFYDNFDDENNGIGSANYTAFGNWTVSDGNVDLIGLNYDDILPGNGLYIDMDGSGLHFGNMDAGKISTEIELEAGDYVLSYNLAGNQRRPGEYEQVNVVLGSFINMSHSLASDTPFTTFFHAFTVSSAINAQLSFEGLGGDDIGMLLDEIKVDLIDPVPEPTTLLFFGTGVASLMGSRARRKKK